MLNTELSNTCKNATWLQYVGACAGKPAGELKVGDVLGWNTGSTSVCKEIVKETPSMITIVEEYVVNGDTRTYERRMKKNRIVAIVENGKFNIVNVTFEEFKFYGGK